MHLIECNHQARLEFIVPSNVTILREEIDTLDSNETRASAQINSKPPKRKAMLSLLRELFTRGSTERHWSSADCQRKSWRTVATFYQSRHWTDWCSRPKRLLIRPIFSATITKIRCPYEADWSGKWQVRMLHIVFCSGGNSKKMGDEATENIATIYRFVEWSTTSFMHLTLRSRLQYF